MVRFILNMIAFFLSMLGFRGIYALGVVLGILSFDVLRIRRRVILKNLEIAFGQSHSLAERKFIGRASTISFIVTIFEFFASERLFPKASVSFVNEEHVREAYPFHASTGLYAMCIHIGNWEYLCHVHAQIYERPVHVVVKAVGSKSVNEWIKKRRTALGYSLVGRHDPTSASQQIREAIAKQQIVGFIVDQKRSRGEVVPFFGRPASTNNSLPKLYLQSPAPILPVVIQRVKPGAYQITYFPVLKYSKDPNLSFSENVTAMTQLMNTQVEEMIRLCPQEYFWMHNRWEV